MVKRSNNAMLPFEDPGNERAVLSVAVTIPSSIVEIESNLTELDFITTHNRIIYLALKDLYLKHQMVRFDIQTIVNYLKTNGGYEACGGFDYINSLFNTMVLKENLPVYTKSVLENSSKKFLFDKLNSLSRLVENNASGPDSKSSSELVGYVESDITDVLMHSTRATEASDIGSTIVEFIEELGTREPGKAGLKTGFALLDTRINGLTPGSLTVLAARPKTGKSLILSQMAKDIAINIDNPVPVLYIDTEMSRDEFTRRLLSNISGVKERLIATGEFFTDPMSRERVYKAGEILKKAKIFHKYMPGVAIEQVSSICRKYYIKEGIRALFFDYIKTPNMELLKTVSEHQLLGHMAQVLKDLAGRLEIPVFAAAQVGRTGAKGKITADMIADSDRLLRYCNTLLALSKKSAEEFAKIESTGGKEALNTFFKMEGGYRLQILETRSGGELQDGINIVAFKEMLRMKEAEIQPDYVYEDIGNSQEDIF